MSDLHVLAIAPIVRVRNDPRKGYSHLKFPQHEGVFLDITTR